MKGLGCVRFGGSELENSYQAGSALAPAPQDHAEPQVSIAQRKLGAVGVENLALPLEKRRRQLLDCAVRMREGLPEAARPFLSDLGAVLEGLTCRISIIGQVKAGKSTFINALTQRAGLLPSNINPWTTAITNLHFGCRREPANLSARMRFFEPDEWDRIWHADGRLRELTERFVPGFEPELLRRHVEEMRRRSEQRLGPALKELLGTVHEYPEFSPPLLEQYVCAGAPIGVAPSENETVQYSDIVKSADIYFDPPGLCFPTIISDTPGTNDPFLVRDEITRRALDQADIHVVVLIARQALSSADVALLRILRGLHKDRIVVFINRIDELGDLVQDVPQVVEHVREGLRREFPGSDMPVIAGSALWAQMASIGADVDIQRVLASNARGYAAQVAPSVPMQANGADPVMSRLSETLNACSGLPDLTRTISRLALESHASSVLQQVASSLAEVGEVSVRSARHEIERLDVSLASEVSQAQSVDSELNFIRERVDQTEKLLSALNTFIIDVQARAEQVSADRVESLEDTLLGQVRQFAETEGRELREAMASDVRGHVWQCDTRDIRRLLEATVISEFRRAEYDLWQLYLSVIPKLHELIEQFASSAQGQRPTPLARLEGRPPSISSLSRFVTLDLSEPFWKRWWSNSKRPEEREAELRMLIREEFYEVVNDLIASTQVQLEEVRAQMLEDVTRNFVLIAEALQERSELTLGRMKELQSEKSALGDDDVRAQRVKRRDELSKHIFAVEPIVGELNELRDAWTQPRNLIGSG